MGYNKDWGINNMEASFKMGDCGRIVIVDWSGRKGESRKKHILIVNFDSKSRLDADFDYKSVDIDFDCKSMDFARDIVAM